MVAQFKKPLRFVLTWTALAVAVPAVCRAAEIVSDPVEPRDGWQVITSGTFAGVSVNPAAQAGSSYFVGVNRTGDRPPASNRGAAKFFKGVTLQPGTYEVSMSVGRLGGVEFVDNLRIQLVADVSGLGSYEWANRIGGAVEKEQRPLPAEGGWARWTLVFTIKDDTKTASKHPVAGCGLGLMVLSSVRDGSGYVFDDVRIVRRP